MTVVWILCIWTLSGVPLGVAVGTALARKRAPAPRRVKQPLQEEAPEYTDASVCM